MKRALRLVLPLLGLSLFCSCASSRRMMKISPFHEGGDELTVADPDRVNLWPLAYKDQDRLSLLWPIVDFDSEGFAVRPLINKEGDDISLLFPLSSFNTKRKVGWLLSAFHYEDADGVVPLFLSIDEFRQIGPWWKAGDEGQGVFPVFGHGERFAHLGPAWRELDEPGGEWESFGLFPLFSADADGDEFWSPLYSHELSDTSRSRSLLLGLGQWSQRNGESRQHVHPLWYRQRNQRQELTALLPFWYDRRKANGDRLTITPLYGHGVDADGDTTFRSVLGPLYLGWNNDRERDLMLAMLYHHHRRDDGSSWRLWPLVAVSNEAEYPDPLYSLTLAGYRRTDDDVSWYATPLIRYHADADSVDWSAWPLIHVERSPRSRRFNTLVHRWEQRFDGEGEPTWRRFGVPLIYRDEVDHRARSRSASLLFGLAAYDRVEDRNQFRLLRYLYRRDQDGDRVARDIFPFIKWDNSDEGYRFSFLWRLLNIEKDESGRSGHLLFVPIGR